VSVFHETSHDWRTAVAEALRQFRRPDGGYAKGPEGVASSTYHTFLVLLCLQLVDRPIAEPESIVRFLCSQQCDEGGFREIRASKRAGTNPTAAAIAALRILDAMTAEIREKTLDFLCEMQTDEGGLRANTRIPIADLLSTFTGLLTLTDLEARDEIDLAHLKRFVFSLDRPEGGFHGAAWDPAHDVEYSFYGLGCAALLG
jgi:geranylgeranyl transferase type-2 subunit beta